MKKYVVFSQRLAGTLMVNQFVLQDMGRTKKGNSTKNVFIFKESEELLKFVDEYSKQYRKSKNK